MIPRGVIIPEDKKPVKGFLIVATGKPDYGNLALNCCLSIRGNSNYPCLLLCTASAIKGIEQQVNKFFAHVVIVESDGHPMAQASFLKVNAYDYATKFFDECIMLDADTLVLPGKSLNSWFDQKQDFVAYYHAVYDFATGKADRENTTFWVEPDKFYEWYSNVYAPKMGKTVMPEKMPQVNASFIYFKKSINAALIFERAGWFFKNYETMQLFDIKLFRGHVNEEPCFNLALTMNHWELPQIPYRPLYLQVFSECIDVTHIQHKYKAFSMAGDIIHDQHIVSLYNRLSDYYREFYGVSEQFHFFATGKAGHNKKYIVDKSVFVPTVKENFVASIYLVGSKLKWNNFSDTPNIKLLENWAFSLKKTGLTGILFHNCFTEDDIKQFSTYPVHFSYAEMPKGNNSGLYRFELYAEFLAKYQDKIGGMFMTDSTDLEMLQNPFTHKKFDGNTIYIGCEPWSFEQWEKLRAARPLINSLSELRELMADKQFAKQTVLNAGLVGGTAHAVTPFINEMAKGCKRYSSCASFQDMSWLNFIAYTKFKSKIAYGPQVNTHFTGYEKDNKVAFVKHK